MTAAVSFESVCFTYDGRSRVLDGLDLTIDQGEYVCILGDNGSGKSTVARLIDGLLVPDEGQVRVFGRSTSHPSDLMQIRASVGMVFQNPDDQLVASVVENEVAFGPENLGLPSDEIRRRVAHALEVVGLVGFEKRRVDELSGGEKQRVAIAGALALDPRVLVLDEATAMIDPMGREGLLRVVSRLNAAGMTIVMITHDTREAEHAGRCVVLGRKSGVEEAGSPCVEEAQNAGVADACTRRFGVQHGGVPDESCGFAAARTPMLSVDHVSFSYEKAPRKRKAYRRREHPRESTPRWGGDPCASWALSDISFEVNEGEVFGIAGHTGSGKSTLIQLMCGLKQPTYGRVLLGQRDLADKREARSACAQVGVAFQYPEYQLFAATVAEDVAFGPRNLGLKDDEVERRVSEALSAVGISGDLAQKSPFELSGGQQRRVALAGVVAMHPEILVMDEPAAGLDASGRRMLRALVRRLRTEGKTIVIVSHDMDDLAQLCDRLLVLDQGRRYLLGAPCEVFSDGDALRAVGLDVPSDSLLDDSASATTGGEA